MSFLEVAIASITVFVGSTVQGSIGFGMGLLAAPILGLLDPRFVPAPILLSSLVLTTCLALRERYEIDVVGVRWALVGRVAGTLVAGMILAVLPPDLMTILFGSVVLVAVAMSVSGVRLQPERSILIGAGMLSALMGTIASIGGPPMALVYQHADGARLRATMSSFFVVGTVMSLTALRLVGRFGADEVVLALVILPAMVAGLLASRWTATRVDRGYTRPLVLVLAAAAGLAVILRQLS